MCRQKLLEAIASEVVYNQGINCSKSHLPESLQSDYEHTWSLNLQHKAVACSKIKSDLNQFVSPNLTFSAAWNAHSVPQFLISAFSWSFHVSHSIYSTVGIISLKYFKQK